MVVLVQHQASLALLLLTQVAVVEVLAAVEALAELAVQALVVMVVLDQTLLRLRQQQV
jgi:hypothetical protein